MSPPKSKVWKHFQKTDKDNVRCNYCDKKFKTSGNTSNMRGYLATFHASTLSSPNKGEDGSNKRSASCDLNSNTKKLKVEREVQASTSKITNDSHELTGWFHCVTNKNMGADCSKYSEKSGMKENIKNAFSDIKSFQEGGGKHKMLTEKILYMVCKDLQPLATVEREGFINLIKYLAPHYTVPSRKTLGNRLDEKYEKLSTNYKNILKTVKEITLTTDLWTETLNTKSFLGITAHYRVGSMMESATLGVYESPLLHTAENLKAKLELEQYNWNNTKLTNKVDKKKGFLILPVGRRWRRT